MSHRVLQTNDPVGGEHEKTGGSQTLPYEKKSRNFKKGSSPESTRRWGKCAGENYA
jgi:hypothetical protein